MIRQTAALFLDSYRELNAKKLFWLVLGLTGLFVAAFAGVGLTDEGISFLVWEIPFFVNRSMFASEAHFYKMLFFSLGFKIWLTWAATILALVSTCGIIPDFVSGGSIELTLSKPIGRVRLLLTKIAAATLFVVLQVAVFTVGAFLVVGLRSGTWVWSFFLAVPLVVLFYSYLYAVCAVIGLVTRSTIAALLLTLLVWFVIFLVHLAETGIFLQFETYNRQAVAVLEGRLETDRTELEKAEDAEEREVLREDIAEKEADLAEARDDLRLWTRIHAIAYAVKTILPKTSETMDLLSRYILSDRELTEQLEGSEGAGQDIGGQRIHGVFVSARVVNREMQEELQSRSVWWVLGTSLLFEGAVLGLGCWHFWRKDY